MKEILGGKGYNSVVCTLVAGTAFLNMPEISDSITRLVVSGGVGIATTLATTFGLHAGVRFGKAIHDLAPEKTGAKKAGAALTATLWLAGGCSGLYYGHNLSKEFMIDVAGDKDCEKQVMINQSDLNERYTLQSNDGQQWHVNGESNLLKLQAV